MRHAIHGAGDGTASTPAAKQRALACVSARTAVRRLSLHELNTNTELWSGFLKSRVNLSVLFQRQSHATAYIDAQVLLHKEAVPKRRTEPELCLSLVPS